MANFEAEYSPWKGRPIRPPIELKQIILPHLCFLITGTTKCRQRTIPIQLTSICLRASSRELNSSGPPMPIPALLMNTSMRPSLMTTVSTALRQSSSSVTSARMYSTPEINSEALLKVPYTLWPSALSLRAICLPKPDPIPVMRMTISYLFKRSIEAKMPVSFSTASSTCSIVWVAISAKRISTSFSGTAGAMTGVMNTPWS